MATIASNRHCGRVLIVEDEALIAHDMRDRLTRLGFEVCAMVSSGEQALEVTGRQRPDIALMDIKLKGDMDGIELAHTLNERHQIPVIFLTANSDHQTLERAVQTAPFGYLTKPVSERDLSIAIEIALYRDAAQRQIQAAEAALRESETRMRSIVETAVDAIVTVDERGLVTSVNPSTERIFGYDAAEILDHNVSMLMPEAVGGHHDGYINAYLETGVGKIIGRGREVEGRRKDGSTVWLELSIASWWVNEQRYFTGTMRDISERKRMEEELKRRNAELAVTNTRLDQFAHIISHDLRAPLRALSNAALWIIEDLAGSANPAIQEHVQRISENRTRMYAMLDDLRDYSRAGLDGAPARPVDLGEIVAAIEKNFPAETNASVSIVGPLQTVTVRRSAIDIVLRNLLENAVSHTDRDSVAISIGCADQGSHLLFEICDDGPGIAGEFHTHIFTPFAKVDPNSTRGGSGMGLTLVKRVIEDNGGEITVASDPAERRGTCFRFTWMKDQDAGGVPVPGDTLH
jgi:PAS domain S-box-containing protein